MSRACVSSSRVLAAWLRSSSASPGLHARSGKQLPRSCGGPSPAPSLLCRCTEAASRTPGTVQAARPLALWLMGAPRTCWGSRSYGRAAAVPWASSLSALGWATQGPAARMGWACSFQKMTRAAGPGGQGPPTSPAGRRLHLTPVPRCLLPSSSRSGGEGPRLWNLPGRLGFVLMCRLVCTGGLGGERSFFLACFCPSVRCFQRLRLTQWRRNHRSLMNELCKQGKLPSLGSPRVPPRKACPCPSTHR